MFEFTQKLATAVAINDVEDEAQSLLDAARNAIGRFEATDEWTAENLATLPQVVDGVVTVMFTDDRGFNTIKKQSLSDSFWIIALKQVQYHLAVNYDLIATAFANWVNDCVYKEHDQLGRKTYSRVKVEVADMIESAKMYLLAMQEKQVIESNLERRVVRLQAGNNITTKVYAITEEFAAQLDENIELLRERASMKCRPLQFKPMDWTDSKTGIAECANIPLIKSNRVKNAKVSKNVLNAVNKLQSVRFTIPECMIEAARDMTMNRALFTSSHRNFFKDKELNNEAFDLYSELLVYKGKEFYFPVTLDQRGRMYYRGGLLSPQGVDFCKAAMQFAEKKPLGEHGATAMYIHLANVCGQDKLPIDERIKWVFENWDMLGKIKTHRDIRKNPKLRGADTFQALVACHELDRLQHWVADCNQVVDFESGLVCHQDGTCNGLQHMAAITGDRKTAEAVNCTASSWGESPSDVYGLVAKTAQNHAEGSPKQMIVDYGRKMAKNPVMVTSYGATPSTIVNNIGKFLTENKQNIANAQDIGDAYLAAINDTAGAVTQLTEAISTRVAFAVEEGMKKFSWRTADGFLASTQYNEDEALAVRVGLFYTRKRGMGKTPIDARKTAQAMAPNFVHSIDATHLRMVINSCDHELVTVHDSIGSHPSDFFTTNEEIRKNFVRVHTEYDALQDLCNSIKQPVPEFPRTGDYRVEEALESSYIFS